MITLDSKIGFLAPADTAISLPEPGPDARPARRKARIEATPGWRAINFAELFEYRELLWILAARDIKVRYKQTALGAAWAILQPLLTMVIFSVVFGKLAGLDKHINGNIPYPIYSLCALLPWMFFANSLAQAGNSLVGNQNMLKKIYFPRLVMPIASILSTLVDFAVAFVVFVVMLVVYSFCGHPIVPTFALLALPGFVLLAFLAALAVGLWLSALNVEYRDVRYVIPFLVQFWMYATPIAYPSSLIREKSERLYTLYGLNPMVDASSRSHAPGFHRQRGGAARRWAVLLPAHGEVLRRSGLGTRGRNTR